MKVPAHEMRVGRSHQLASVLFDIYKRRAIDWRKFAIRLEPREDLGDVSICRSESKLPWPVRSPGATALLGRKRKNSKARSLTISHFHQRFWCDRPKSLACAPGQPYPQPTLASIESQPAALACLPPDPTQSDL